MQSQLAVCKHRIDAGKAPRPRFNQAFRILWVILSKVLDRWEDLAQVMKPATVKKWHTTAFRLFWRWKSRPGRPEIEPAMQAHRGGHAPRQLRPLFFLPGPRIAPTELSRGQVGTLADFLISQARAIRLMPFFFEKRANASASP